MIYTGLLSVSFRQLQPTEIIALTAEAGLQGIEWGGDVHVPPDEPDRAAEIGRMTRDAGLQVASYGSYYKVGLPDNKHSFERIVEAAVRLGAPTIRVWAGDRGSARADEPWWDRVVEDSFHCAELASEAGLTVDYEYHSNTLTDTVESTERLLRLVDASNIRSNWQQPVNWSAEECHQSLNGLLPRLAHLHVYYWEGRNRLSLEEGKQVWKQYLRIASRAEGNRFAMLEFVKDDEPDQFKRDAQALLQLVGEL